MNKEFKELYDNWHKDTCLLSSRDFKNEQGFIDLVNWSKDNKKEAVESITEMLKKEPNFVVYILDELFDHPITCEGYIPLDQYCNAWIALIEFYNSGETDTRVFSITKDYYKDWREYQEYMKDNYLPWNPTKEQDPNVTLEEYKMCKRNNPNFRRPIQMVKLKDEDFKRETTRE